MTIFRQVPSRNSRSKGGFKMKNFLQVCFLVAICVWLLYQIKHSQNKKAFEEQDARTSFKDDESQSEIKRFSRKDLPRTVVIDSPDEEANEDSEEVEHEIEHEEGEVTGDHGRNEGAKHKEQVDHEEGKKGQDMGLFEDQEHRDHQEHDEASHEAREKSFKGDDPASEVVNSAHEHEEASHEAKNFKGDDPSSKVVHDTQEHEEAFHEVSFRGDNHSSKVANDTQGHEEASHEAREKSFRGDDEPGEIIHKGHEADHEDGSHEARERSFKGDDVSSAVDHIPEVEESELENGGTRDSDEHISENTEKKDDEIENVNGIVKDSEGNDSSAIQLYGTSKDANSSVHENEILPKEKGSVNLTTLEKTEQVVLTEFSKGAPTNTTAGESGNHREQQLDLKIVSVVDNQMEPQMNTKNTSDTQVQLHSNSTNIVKNEENILQNFTIFPQDHTETPANQTTIVDPTTNGASMQNQTVSLLPQQDRNNTVKMETLAEEKLNLVNEIMGLQSKSETTARYEGSEQNSKASSSTNENKMEVSLESNNSLHSVAADKERNEQHDPSSNLPDIQNKATSGKQESAE